jgi:hypothetical protein
VKRRVENRHLRKLRPDRSRIPDREQVGGIVEGSQRDKAFDLPDRRGVEELGLPEPLAAMDDPMSNGVESR